MNRLIALFYFFLSLVGFDVGGSSFEHRTMANGTDVLLSRAHVQAGVARFECVRSASGECHYMVLPKACDTPPPATVDAADACAGPPIARFVLGEGESHQISGLQHFRLCVAQADDDTASHCRAPHPSGEPRHG